MSDAERRNEAQSALPPEATAQTRSQAPGAFAEGYCPSCGHRNPAEARYCGECGKEIAVERCPKCGHTVPQGGDLCEACGAWLDATSCPFCGTRRSGDAPFCSECGNPVDGLTCPACGARSFFDYCPSCHLELTEQAEEMQTILEGLDETSAYMEANKELRELLKHAPEEQRGSGSTGEAEEHAAQPDASDAAKAIAALAQARRAAGCNTRDDRQAGAPEFVRPNLEKRAGEARRDARDFGKEERKRRLEELQAKQAVLLETLSEQPRIPPGFTTNQQVRRYYMALKPPTTRGWRCNAYHAIHSDPMHCAKPGDGGVWLPE
ncbi:MAG: zinc ribbon domain-containing protein [Spirochaetales bacterium]